MKRLALVSVLVGLLAAPAWAQLSPKYADWPDGPVKVLLTAPETAAYAALTSDEAAQHFIDLFWAKRDPDLNTRANEFRLDFEARAAAADKQFGEPEGTRGALTDRGKTLLLLGAPAKAWTESIQSFLSKLYNESPMGMDQPTSARDAQGRMHGVSFSASKGLANVWVYTREQIPATIDIPKRVDSVVFAFFDAEGKDHFSIERNIREAKWGLKVLEEMPTVLVKHPEITELPTFPLLPGAVAASSAQLAWLASPVTPEGAQASVTQGIRTANEFPGWVFIQLPESVPAADLMVGRLTLADGSVDGTFQQAVTPVAAKHGRVYELALPAPVGDSSLELALTAGDKPVAVFKLPVHIDGVAAGATWISPFFAGAELQQEQTYEAGTPFVFGGYHLILRPDAHYGYDENLDYFCLVVRPGLGEDGKPKARLRVKLQLGTQGQSFPVREAELSPVSPDVYMFGSQLPLNILPKAGEYTLKVTLEDQVSGVSSTTEIPMVMPEKK